MFSGLTKPMEVNRIQINSDGLYVWQQVGAGLDVTGHATVSQSLLLLVSFRYSRITGTTGTFVDLKNPALKF